MIFTSYTDDSNIDHIMTCLVFQLCRYATFLKHMNGCGITVLYNTNSTNPLFQWYNYTDNCVPIYIGIQNSQEYFDLEY